jgi:thymidylate kinase
MSPKTVYGIEGLDRLGKSTLIEGIRNALGYYEVIHFSKPQRLDAYRTAMPVAGVPPGGQGIYHYQHESFVNSMLLANSGARIIFDRWHLGEVVYSPMYRGYDGDYVFDLETRSGVDVNGSIRLILLVEDFDIARHFVDDGESLGAVDKREEEQGRFIDALNRSAIKDKRTICVTDPALGGFKPKDWILAEALA